MKRDDGPAGWRKCPNGHRMIVTSFESDSDGGQRRVVVSDLVGGVKMTDDHIKEWTENMAVANEKDRGGLGAGGQGQLARGRWTWHDPAEAEADTGSNNGGIGHRRLRSRQATIVPPNAATAASTPTTTIATPATPHKSSFLNSKFPPNGGFGTTCIALWSYYPEEGEGGKGELMFPKGAEVTEVEEVNEEWSEGVYAGEIGLVPSVYVRDVAT